MNVEKKPRIRCLPNGPYQLLSDPEPTPVSNLYRADGEACATTRSVSLCRCGGSQNKPFCDGTHGKNGFTDGKTADGSQDRRTSYAGKHVTIHDNRGLCAHAGVCTDRLQSVFRMKQEPWIDPDGATVEEIIATVSQCPSGALSYSVDGVEHRDQDGAPRVTVADDGPYAVSGGVELAAITFGDGASQEHYTL